MSEVNLLREYDWISSVEQFYLRCADIFPKIEGKKLNRVYAVFDKVENDWFFDAPMLVEIGGSLIYINVSNSCYTAIGINEFFPDEKPIWYRDEVAPDGWQEDLEWRIFEDVSLCFGMVVKTIMPITSELYEKLFSIRENGVNGVLLELEHGELWIHDNGDEIFAQYME